MKTKSKPSLNAITHGAYAQELLLPWENAEDLIVLESQLRNELQPIGVLESEQVNEILNLLWIRRRVVNAMHLMFYRSPISREIRKSGKKTVRGIHRHLEKRAKEYDDERLHLELRVRSVNRKINILTQSRRFDKDEIRRKIEEIKVIQTNR